MKIDTAKIPGFDALPEEARTAILGMEFADALDMSGYVTKETFDKKASETAELNRKLKAQMSEEEKAAAERDAKWAEMEAKLAELEREKLESGYRAEFLALGYDEALAAETAKALAEGDTAKVFANQKKHLDSVEKRARADALKDTPKPTHDGDSKMMTLEKLRKLTPQERYDYAVKNPEEYKTLYANKNTNDTGGNE